MRIVFATESYYPNIDGGAVAEHNLAIELAKNGHDVSILAPAANFSSYTEKDKNTTIYRRHAYTWPFYKDYKVSPFPAIGIGRIIKEFKPDVVHLHNPWAIGTTALLYAKYKGIPIVGSNHLQPENLVMHIAKTRFLFRVLERGGWRFLVGFYNLCDHVVSPTQTAVNMLLDNGLNVSATPISNGIDFEIFNPKNDPGKLQKRYQLPAKPKVLYTGRISGEKRLDVWVKAAKKVLEEIECHFIICGGGREKESLCNMVKELGISDNVTLTGFIPEEDFPGIYALADLFAISSEAELQSIVTMEALATGLPVVATNKDALPELVHDGKNGFLFTPGDADDMARKIIKILASKELRKTMGKESLKIIQKHSLSSVVCQFEDVYKKAIKS
ncbi:glycosyltransferase [Thiorhodovibrio frisius]|uniref:Glycosyltransferase n=1 Tax=Thiorhodovibrio frisius TaxID=631362 RepID=H8Z3N4_9GAMM|nr:glycosyltransferase [Thiorhodovibrio frisius]EIC20023.1 glycosyltransferase [Thiorhodovibrio frisius]WPL20751.1 GDP-mannose-dependent alpha-mannosyltransferase [Thiorhodovibrio frisius]